MAKGIPFSPEEKKWLEENSANLTTPEMAKHTGRHSKTILNYLKRNNLPFIKLSGKFEKGNKTWNLGIPMSEKVRAAASKTFFKKGGIPKTRQPVGTERMMKGFVEIKVADPNVWKFKQRHIWEQHHGMEVPPGYKIIFRDGNPMNFDISNLEKIHMTNLLFRNSGRPEQDEKILEAQWLLKQLSKTIEKLS